MSEYQTCIWEMLGFLQKKASKGVMLPALELMVLLIVYMAMAKASAQRKSRAPASFNKVHPLSNISSLLSWPHHFVLVCVGLNALTESHSLHSRIRGSS